jgi:6-phosphogluconate dehydrogenase (decarboxylating)
MVPAGKGANGDRRARAAASSEDIIVDGGNAFYKDSVRRAVRLPATASLHRHGVSAASGGSEWVCADVRRLTGGHT